MPFQSDKQRKLMYAVANNPAVAKKTGIRKDVADKFIEHKAKGGSMKKTFRKDEDSAAYKAKERKHVAAMEKHGVPKNIIAEEKREAGLKRGGGVKKYAIGGAPMGSIQGNNFGAQQAAQRQFQASPQFQLQPVQSPGVPLGSIQGNNFGAQQAAQLAAQQRMQPPQMTAPATQMQNTAGQQLSPMQQSQLAALQQQMMAESQAASARRQASPGFQPVGAAIQSAPGRVTAPGRVAIPNPRGRGVMSNMASGGPTKKYAFGGMTGPGGEMSPDDMAQFAESLKKEADTRRAKQGGAGMGGSPTVGFKKGGRIDGCATKGKTKGRFI